MNVAVRKPMSVSEFLAWEARQEGRYEFDGERPRLMTGGTVAHDSITFNLRAALVRSLGDSPCRPYGPNLKIVVAGRARYPDVVVACTPQAPGSTIIDRPVAVFEVVSSGTERVDRIEKLREYQATASIQHYVILEQTSIGATIGSRSGDVWTVRALVEGEMIDLPAVGVGVLLADCYRGVELPILASDDDMRPSA